MNINVPKATELFEVDWDKVHNASATAHSIFVKTLVDAFNIPKTPGQNINIYRSPMFIANTVDRYDYLKAHFAKKGSVKKI